MLELFPFPTNASGFLKTMDGFERPSRLRSDTFVPADAGCGAVDNGLGFIIGASEGCGGGVAR